MFYHLIDSKERVIIIIYTHPTRQVINGPSQIGLEPLGEQTACDWAGEIIPSRACTLANPSAWTAP